jgi:leucyl aminopeptidase
LIDAAPMSLPCFAADSDVTDIFALRPGESSALDPIDARWLETVGFRGQAHRHVLLADRHGSLKTVVAGLGDSPDLYTLADLPHALPAGSYRLDPTLDRGLRERLSLGWALGAYQFNRYRAAKRAPATLKLGDDLDRARIEADARAVALVRDLVNTGADEMGPAELADATLALAHEHGAAFRQVVGDELLAHGFPAIHAVGRASPRAPRLIELQWGDPSHRALTIVGKGVCFDTGGLDIKPADGMRYMKKDMGGAAHALALAQRVLDARLPVHLRLLISAVDNAIDGNAYRPGDVIRTRAGKRIEIGNTDAEGRIVLSDALTLACEEPPELLIDFATLTGAARIALGPDLPPAFSNQPGLAQALADAGERVDDPMWPMPLWKPYLSYLKSPIADMNNDGGRMAGAVTAALFLDAFVAADVPWLHIDTYAWADRDRPGRPAGGAALGLRAAFALIEARFGLSFSERIISG